MSENLKKIFKNTTGSDIELTDFGLTIPASGQLEIEPSNYALIADDVIESPASQVVTLINSGDLVINDGVGDLSADRAIDYIKFPDRAFNIRFESDPERVNGFISKNVQEAIEESRQGFEGKGFQTTFAGNGTFRDKWMSQEDTNVESNESPDIFKYTARLVGVDFTNENQNADATIIFAIKEYPFTTVSNPDRFYKWTLSDVRSAVRTNQMAGFTVKPGDCMAVYLMDDGGNSADIILTMDFIILSAPTTEIQFTYNQNFSSNDFPAIGTIPEILT